MAHLVAEAIEIITDDGSGVVSSYSNSGIGLASDGHFYLITDRFGLSGAKTITGDTARTVWYEGILTRDFGAFSISRNCDFVESGALESVSGFSFAIKNTAAFWNTIKAAAIYLGRRTVKYYRVTSSDGVTFNFELRWTGVIDDQPFNELTQSVQCVDNSKDIFKTAPLTAVNSTSFPLAPSDSLDKMIPVAMGRVAYSPLINVQGSGAKTNLCLISSIYYTVAASFAYLTAPGIYGVWLYTPGINFLANDVRLVGKFLAVVAGGTEQAIRITSNSATEAATYAGKNATVIFLADPLTPISPAAGCYDNSTSSWISTSLPATDTVWYFQVLDLSPALVSSTKSISQLIRNAQGRSALYNFDSALKAYDDVSEIQAATDLNNIRSTGYPGYSVVTKSSDLNGGLSAYFSIVPPKIIAGDVSFVTAGATTSDLPAPGSDCPLLRDQAEGSSHRYTFTNNVPNPIGTITFTLYVYLPPEEVLKTFESVWILLDMSHVFSASTTSVAGVITAYALDLYGRKINTLVASESIFSVSIGTVETAINLLPGSYFNTSRDDSAFYLKKELLDISSIISNTKKSSAYNAIRIDVGMATTGPSNTYTLHLEEVGFIGKRAVSVTSESIYGSVIGETFGTGWGGRKVSTDPVLLLPDAFEKLLRQYDETAPVWLPGQAYIVGNKIRSTLDNGHIFLCTVAGTSHASTEPTWTTTAGATYSDGTVTWKEFKTIPIDTASFDTLNVQRANWFIGRTLTEKKSTADYYAELCAQGFLIATITAAGKVKLKAWRENTTPLMAFDSSNILQGSLGDVKLTPMRRVWNDLFIQYDENPGAKNFNRQIGITNIDQPAFPGVSEYMPGTGTSLGAFSVNSFATGLGGYILQFTTTVVHGLATGAYVALTGNTAGYNIPPTVISVTGPNDFYVGVGSGVFTARPSTTGTLNKLTDSNLKWHTFAIGIQSYATGKALWDQCHSSYVISKTVQKLPNTLGDCHWFIDPYALVPGGKPASTGVAGGPYFWPDLNVGDDHPAVYFAQNLVEWAAWQKKQVTLEVIDTATYSVLEIGDPVSFTDAKLTAGDVLLGWINEKTQLPRTDKNPERFRFGITMNPEQLTTSLILDENGATDIYDENGATNIVDENGA